MVRPMPPSPRRFVPPWRVTHLPGGWEVADKNGVVLVRVYGCDARKGVADQSLTMDEARRIAAGIARLPELMGWVPAPMPDKHEDGPW